MSLSPTDKAAELMLRGLISKLEPDQQKHISECADSLRRVLSLYDPAEAGIAIALVSIEEAAKL